MKITRFLALLIPFTTALSAPAAPSLEAVTFALDSKRTFLPLIEASQQLGWPPRRNEEKGTVILNGKTFSTSTMRTLTDGTRLISLDILAKAGATGTPQEDDSAFKVASSQRYFRVIRAGKRAEVNLKDQRLRAWEGKRLVLDTNISSGRGSRTPSGEFKAGPYKARRHYSSRYNNAYMPYSVQVTGHIFIHGFKHVPKYPASHGCIRVPYLTGGNPARFFYEWIDKGTPITIVRK
jgi:hypothetical protein